MFRRINGDVHFRIIIVSFVLTILAIRAYLAITGYPQIGGGGLHFAHLLWGGVALFLAGLIALLYQGLYLSRVVALLVGVGWGFFIDEVGKFITADNNYFFAPAAVIIYVVFLLIVAAYLSWFQGDDKKIGSPAQTLTEVGELLDGIAAGHLTYREQHLLSERLTRLKQQSVADPSLHQLARALEQYGKTHPLQSQHRRLDRWAENLEHYVARAVRTPWFMVVLLGVLSIELIVVGATSFRLLDAVRASLISGTAASVHTADWIKIVSGIARVLVGTGVVAGAFFIRHGRSRLGRALLLGGALILVVVLDAIDFYFAQFSASFTVALDMLVFVMADSLSRRGRVVSHK